MKSHISLLFNTDDTGILPVWTSVELSLHKPNKRLWADIRLTDSVHNQVLAKHADKKRIFNCSVIDEGDAGTLLTLHINTRTTQLD